LHATRDAVPLIVAKTADRLARRYTAA